MAEHLAILSSRTLRRLYRKPILRWSRRRREAPIGRVRTGDLIHVKVPSGLVVARGTVSSVREEKIGGTYVLSLQLRRFQKLRTPFPIEKHDRRSWVVCAPSDDAQQQRLLVASPPTIEDLLRVMRTTRRRLPSRCAVRIQLAALARTAGTDGSLLLWLALLAEASAAGTVSQALRDYARKPARGVVPFAVF